MRWFQSKAKSGDKARSRKTRRSEKARGTRRLAIECLEGRTLMSASPLGVSTATVAGKIAPAVSAAVQSAAPKVQAPAPDRIFSVNYQLGGGILGQIINLKNEIDGFEQSVDAVLSEIPCWHLEADIDRTPSFSGYISGTIDEASNGALKSASLSLSITGSMPATVEGYYGMGYLNIGLGATVNVADTLNASATYTTGRGWTFGGYDTLSGSLTGFAQATAAIWKGELYSTGNLTSVMTVSPGGIVYGNTVLTGYAGADIQQYNPWNGSWNNIWDNSLRLGQYSLPQFSFNSVALFQDGVSLAAPYSGVIV
jgi:hypothetical protein